MYLFEESPIVSAFENYTSSIPYKQVNLLKCLITDKYKDEVERYRNSDNEREKKSIKSSLPCVTVSGIFTRRCESDIIIHSGYICLDIDGKDQTGIIDWEAIKKIVSELFDSVYIITLSISGNGICIIVRIRNPLYHKMHYWAFAKEISEATGLKVDMSCSDVARLRGASYDPAPYYNPHPTQYNKVMIREKRKNAPVAQSQSEKNRKNVKEAIALILTHRIDITKQYSEWLKIAMAIYDEFGEDGRADFHLISSIYQSYDEAECNRMYDKCESWGTDIRLETFFYLCKINGIIYRKGGMVYDPSIIREK